MFSSYSVFIIGAEPALNHLSKFRGPPQVKTFISPVWTLEYDICLSGLKRSFYTAVLRAEKIQNSNKIGLTEDKIKEVDDKVKADFTAWKTKTDQEIAYEIYVNDVIKKGTSKAIISQSFTEILKKGNQVELKGKILKDKYLAYLVDSINYACG